MIIQLQKILLIFFRITSFILISPGFSYHALPNIFKIGLSLSMAMIVYMITPDMEVVGGLVFFIVLAVKEILFGLSIGFVTRMIFATMEIAGQLIDFQVGFSMASVYDPQIGGTSSNYGRLFYWMSISIFFILNIHHIIIETVIQSFHYIPITMVNLRGFGIGGLTKLFSIIFELGFNLAAPMIITVLLTDIVLGVISRTVPQINVLMLGMPLKVGVSFIIILLILSGLLNSIGNILGLIPEYLQGLFKALNGG